MKFNQLTDHAQSRMQQRAIPPLILDWLQSYGAIEHDHRGAEVHYFGHDAKRRIAKDVGQKVVDLLGAFLDAYMVTSNQGDVITCGYRYKKINRV